MLKIILDIDQGMKQVNASIMYKISQLTIVIFFLNEKILKMLWKSKVDSKWKRFKGVVNDDVAPEINTGHRSNFPFPVKSYIKFLMNDKSSVASKLAFYFFRLLSSRKCSLSTNWIMIQW